MDQNTSVVALDHPAAYPEIDLMFLTVFQTLNH